MCEYVCWLSPNCIPFSTYICWISPSGIPLCKYIFSLWSSSNDLKYHLRVWQLYPIQPDSHIPSEHTPVGISHPELSSQWHTSLQLLPNCPGEHSEHKRLTMIRQTASQKTFITTYTYHRWSHWFYIIIQMLPGKIPSVIAVIALPSQPVFSDCSDFNPLKGICQGCPIFAYLFVICVELFACKIREMHDIVTRTP